MNYKNMHFGEGNLRSVANSTYGYLTWSLPSRSTCPYATEMCKAKCFAKKNETFESVRRSRNNNLEESKKDAFVPNVIELIEKYLAKKKCQGKLIIVRIHTSGDFYSREYLLKWVAIANYFKGRSEIMFQSYTKSVKFLKGLDLKDINIHFVYSIWKDTNKDDIALARQLELPTFTALSRKEVEEARERGIYVCPKSSDGLCKECYKCNHKEIVVSYH